MTLSARLNSETVTPDPIPVTDSRNTKKHKQKRCHRPNIQALARHSRRIQPSHQYAQIYDYKFMDQISLSAYISQKYKPTSAQNATVPHCLPDNILSGYSRRCLRISMRSVSHFHKDTDDPDRRNQHDHCMATTDIPRLRFLISHSME